MIDVRGWQVDYRHTRPLVVHEMMGGIERRDADCHSTSRFDTVQRANPLEQPMSPDSMRCADSRMRPSNLCCRFELFKMQSEPITIRMGVRALRAMIHFAI
jgi:hypothetical protein